MNPKVDFFFSKAKKWQQELEQLRTIVLECGLTEELKWGKPCYMFNESNVIVMQAFKEYCALLFLKGMLLNNPDGVLVKTGEHTVVGRQIRFTSIREIVEMKAIVKAYIYEAIEVEKAGLKIDTTKNTELKLPEEFQHTLEKNAALKDAFNSLTPGRQKAYNIYFSQPKQSKTREARIEKYVQQILDGKGLNDE